MPMHAKYFWHNEIKTSNYLDMAYDFEFGAISHVNQNDVTHVIIYKILCMGI